MQILAIVGSLRAGSYNLQLAETARTIMEDRHPDVSLPIFNWGDVPVLNQDEEQPAPEAVNRARSAVNDSDGIWLFSPEYNHAIPGPLKNFIDWLSRPANDGEGQVLAGKPIALAGASVGMSGAGRAQDQLVCVLSFLDARIMNLPRVAIPSIAAHAADGRVDPGFVAPHLERQADAFVSFIRHETEGV